MRLFFFFFSFTLGLSSLRTIASSLKKEEIELIARVCNSKEHETPLVYRAILLFTSLDYFYYFALQIP